VAPRGLADEPLEAGLADFDVARGGGDHPAIVDQEGLGGIGADRHLARDVDPRTVEHARR
jgi:hypothetical protein